MKPINPRPSSQTSPRPHRARRGEGERLRDEILDAAEELLIDTRNADKVSIRMVADAIGKTPPSIYLHFGTKDQLLHAVCQRQFDAMTERFREVCEGVDDPTERISRMGQAYLEFALEHPEQYRILFMSGTATGMEVKDLDDLNLTECFGMLHEAVADGMERGTFTKADSGVVALALWAAVHGLASLLIAHDLDWPSLEDLAGQVLAQNIRGLAVDPTTP